MSDKFRQLVREMILEEFNNLEENSTSAATPGFQTPKAFKSGEGDEKGPDTPVHKPVKWSDGDGPLEEGRSHYSVYKSQHGAPKEKIGRAIREIDGHLKDIHKLLDMNAKLKQDNDLQTTELWRRTLKQISRIEQNILQIARKIKELKA
jgi:hypothetical protein